MKPALICGAIALWVFFIICAAAYPFWVFWVDCRPYIVFNNGIVM